jgi:hypothetical protein
MPIIVKNWQKTAQERVLFVAVSGPNHTKARNICPLFLWIQAHPSIGSIAGDTGAIIAGIHCGSKGKQ